MTVKEMEPVSVRVHRLFSRSVNFLDRADFYIWWVGGFRANVRKSHKPLYVKSQQVSDKSPR